MRSFLKYTLASLTALLIASVIATILGIGSLMALIAVQEKTEKVKPNSVFMLSLEGILEERTLENPLDELLGNPTTSLGLEDILSSIAKAKKEPNISGIYLRAGSLQTSGTAMLQEIRNALLDFKTSGKFVVAYGDVYTQGGYYVCSVADELMINPEGMINWMGMAAQPIFYKNTLEKIGVKMQVVKVGEYKSAVEPFTETQMSEANRTQITALLESIWSEVAEAVASSRNIPVDTLNLYAERSTALSPTSELVAQGMVDRLAYRTEMSGLLKERLGLGASAQLNLITLSQMKRLEEKIRFNTDEIALYYAFGDIVDERLSPLSTGISAQKMCKDLKKLQEDNKVKAVVIRINSGGGSAYASEQIWHAITQLRNKKPVIISMGGAAASGGYYIASAGHHICAEPTTLTGSIGIFGLFPDASELLEEKLGLRFDAVKTHRHADMGSLTRPFNAEERQMLQGYIERGYALFKKRVERGRNLSPEAVEKIAQGRVWTGSQAANIGLVDELGGVDVALAQAAKQANLADYEVKGYPESTPWYIQLLESSSTDILESKFADLFGLSATQLKALQTFDPRVNVQARTPFELNILQ